jgi:hypothetical protein
MDAVAADVTDVPGVALDDEFVLLGAQDGDRITATELARRRNTIAWEAVTTMAARLPRVYHSGSGLTGVRTLAGEILVGGRSPVPETAREAAGPVTTPVPGAGTFDRARDEQLSGQHVTGSGRREAV